MDAHELVFVVCASSLKLDGIVRGLTDDNYILDFFCSNHALVVILTK